MPRVQGYEVCCAATHFHARCLLIGDSRPECFALSLCDCFFVAEAEKMTVALSKKILYWRLNNKQHFSILSYNHCSGRAVDSLSNLWRIEKKKISARPRTDFSQNILLRLRFLINYRFNNENLSPCIKLIRIDSACKHTHSANASRRMMTASQVFYELLWFRCGNNSSAALGLSSTPRARLIAFPLRRTLIHLRPDTNVIRIPP